MKIVFDTNIYLSGLVFPTSKPASLLSLASQKKFELFISNFILDELRRNLTGKFGYNQEAANMFVDQIVKSAKIILPENKINIIQSKKDDNRILDCAISAKANYLVTGDKKHILPLGKIGKCKIISASNFLELFEQISK